MDVRKFLLVPALTLVLAAALSVRPAHADVVSGSETVLAYQEMDCSFFLPAPAQVDGVAYPAGTTLHGLGPGETGALFVRFGMAHLDLQNGNLTFNTTCRATLTTTSPYHYVGNWRVQVYGTFQGALDTTDLDHFQAVETWSSLDTLGALGWTQIVIEGGRNASCYRVPNWMPESCLNPISSLGFTTPGTTPTTTTSPTSPCNPSRRTFACNCEGLFFNPVFCQNSAGNNQQIGPGGPNSQENSSNLFGIGITLYNAPVVQNDDFTYTLDNGFAFFYGSGTVLGNFLPPGNVPSTDEIHAAWITFPDFFFGP